MAHITSQENLSPVEREFRDLMQHGDDFLKIELLRPAKSYYKRALELNLETEKVKQLISLCDKMLAAELKVIWILAALASIVILALIIF